MAFASAPELLVLHGVRIQGMADADSISKRFSLDRILVEDLLLDDEAFGWVQRVGFADLSGWSLTAAGRAEGNRNLSAELDAAGARSAITDAHVGFAQLNSRLLTLITRWQIRPIPGAELAANDHSDWRWDENVIQGLAGISRKLEPLGDQLGNALARLGGYPRRFAAALDRVNRGERKWVDQTRIDSCHTVWFELHEDLLATLGLERGSGG